MFKPTARFPVVEDTPVRITSSYPIRIRMTYEVVSSEEELGPEVVDHGFYVSGGYKYSVSEEDIHFQSLVRDFGRDAAIEIQTPDPDGFDDIEDAINFVTSYGFVESSCSQPPCANQHCWLTTTDDDTDYGTGESTRYSFHIECDDDAVHNEIIQRAAK